MNYEELNRINKELYELKAKKAQMFFDRIISYALMFNIEVKRDGGNVFIYGKKYTLLLSEIAYDMNISDNINKQDSRYYCLLDNDKVIDNLIVDNEIGEIIRA